MISDGSGHQQPVIHHGQPCTASSAINSQAVVSNTTELTRLCFTILVILLPGLDRISAIVILELVKSMQVYPNARLWVEM